MVSKLKKYIVKNSSKKTVLLAVLVVAIPFLYGHIKALYNWFLNGYKSEGSTLTSEQAFIKSEQLKEAFDNLQPYNYNAIKTPLLGLSAADYYKVKQSFGVVPRGFILGDVFVGFGSSVMAENLDLSQWIVRELDNDELIQLKNANTQLPI